MKAIFIFLLYFGIAPIFADSIILNVEHDLRYNAVPGIEYGYNFRKGVVIIDFTDKGFADIDFEGEQFKTFYDLDHVTSLHEPRTENDIYRFYTRGENRSLDERFILILAEKTFSIISNLRPQSWIFGTFERIK